MPMLKVFDGRNNEVVLQARGKGMYERLNADGSGTGWIVNLQTAIQCGSLFTEERHKAFLAKKASRK